jgi:RHS repeat-associated protein
MFSLLAPGGSRRDVVNGSSGALTESTAYDAWGNPETSGGLAAVTPFGYTDTTGLSYLINRYYDRQTGQFLSVDPHPLGLKQLAKMMGEVATSTVVSDKLTRQGIVHGRVLAYDTLRNSTKAWAGLLAVIEAMEPRAKEIAEKEAEAYGKRWAGSEEVIEWGAQG